MTDTAAPQKKSRLLVAQIKGRIELSRQYQGSYYTRLTTPARDEFSKPSQFEIRSQQPLGDQGSVFQGFIELSGFLRDRKFTDQKTGEIKEYTDKNVFFDLVVN